MSDATTLRTLLIRTDASAPAIQATAGAMMKHYDKSSGVAVVEWRNALHQARPDQHLPLLYVANEVLQNSKRNRGNKFLEAFSPILGQSLIFISSKNSSSVVEKVRRTVKIWGDRHVFSIRYVNELLKGLEPYRHNNNNNRNMSSTTTTTASSSTTTMSSSSAGNFSPLTQPSTNNTTTTSSNNNNNNYNNTNKMTNVNLDRDSSDVGNNTRSSSGGSGGGRSDDDDDDDGGDLFGDDGIKLDVKFDLEQAATEASKPEKRTSGMKRRRPSSGTGDSSIDNDGKVSSNGTPKASTKVKKMILSTNSLMDLWNQIAALEQSYDHALTIVSGTKPNNLEPEHIESLVGDELLDTYKRCLDYEQRVKNQRKELHRIATKRRSIEQEALRYLPWLENSLKQDDEDIEFCNNLQKQLELFLYVHGPARAARDKRLREEAKRQHEQEELLKKKKEEEERKKFMESAMKKETEAKPGMVWNKALGEYVYLQTDESWRD